MGVTQAASLSNWFESGMFAGKYGNAIGSGLVGGTASVAAGGDFAMGAVQGAMSRFLNDRAHPVEESNSWSVGDPLPQWMVDSSAGFGDGLLLGFGDNLRSAFGVDGGVNPLSMEYGLGYVTGVSVDAAILGGAAIRGYRAGSEIFYGKNLRIAQFGNRTGHPLGEYPHYHRRQIDLNTNQTVPGQGIGRHRPWETKSTDTKTSDRF